jgi:hypothetical protein
MRVWLFTSAGYPLASGRRFGTYLFLKLLRVSPAVLNNIVSMYDPMNMILYHRNLGAACPSPPNNRSISITSDPETIFYPTRDKGIKNVAKNEPPFYVRTFRCIAPGSVFSWIRHRLPTASVVFQTRPTFPGSMHNFFYASALHPWTFRICFSSQLHPHQKAVLTPSNYANLRAHLSL